MDKEQESTLFNWQEVITDGTVIKIIHIIHDDLIYDTRYVKHLMMLVSCKYWINLSERILWDPFQTSEESPTNSKQLLGLHFPPCFSAFLSSINSVVLECMHVWEMNTWNGFYEEDGDDPFLLASPPAHVCLCRCSNAGRAFPICHVLTIFFYK